MLKATLAALGLLAAASAAASAQTAPSLPAVSSLGVEGTEIVVGLADGRTLRSKDLVGAVLKVRFEGEPALVRIAAVEAAPGPHPPAPRPPAGAAR
ncbi:MAG: hypothetical protein IBJ17_03490, partial [Reyranella sp.]|nr:hypothetical protein [Reyranella sp.]